MEYMRYAMIVFLQDHEANGVMGLLNEYGEEKAFGFLMQWHTGEEPIEEIDDVPWGKYDKLYKKDNFVMSYNTSLGYIGLQEVIEICNK